MGPNSINTFNNTAAMGTTAAPAEVSAGKPPTSAGGIKIHYGDSIKADRLQAGLRGLQAAQAKTELFIRSINPELGKL